MSYKRVLVAGVAALLLLASQALAALRFEGNAQLQPAPEFLEEAMRPRHQEELNDIPEANPNNEQDDMSDLRSNNRGDDLSDERSPGSQDEGAGDDEARLRANDEDDDARYRSPTDDRRAESDDSMSDRPEEERAEAPDEADARFQGESGSDEMGSPTQQSRGSEQLHRESHTAPEQSSESSHPLSPHMTKDGLVVARETKGERLPLANIIGEAPRTTLTSDQVDEVARHVLKEARKARCEREDEYCDLKLSSCHDDLTCPDDESSNSE